ncbi:tyrosine-type recombinase/integrase [Nonomuraea mesophila]|uniref:tyrosine-type recombinase/integrase n=1 Tax=Nonomuraea mesophila TaxID=2530382 RepID=UPI001FE5E16D|nr:tyrosine-type recombinase/integrase [Nonomuraea mesophila]
MARTQPGVLHERRHSAGRGERTAGVPADHQERGDRNDWTPRELRHSFVSIMSDQRVPIETIADLVGHAGTSLTEAVYRHQRKPVITKGAHTMNTFFGDKPTG